MINYFSCAVCDIIHNTLVDGVPARIVHERVRRQLMKWHGWSSDHFLDARLSTQFFPFGNRKTVRARFLNPDGQIADVDLVKWGPGGKGLSRAEVTLPSGVDAEGLVVTSSSRSTWATSASSGG